MSVRRFYVSIPITGQDYQMQRELAMEVKRSIECSGDCEVITPFDIVTDISTPYNVCMGRCVEALLECDVICMAGDFKSSKGCMAEKAIAQIYGLEVRYL